jgi:hypothetical protein
MVGIDDSTGLPRHPSGCTPQPRCGLGYFASDSNPSKSEQVQCDACEDHTYVNNEIISQAENTGFRPTACVNQEMLGPGYGSIDYDPSNHTQIMQQEECDGIYKYQTKQAHQEPCRTHPLCGPGELRTGDSSIEEVPCVDIPMPTNHSEFNWRGYGYMDQLEHREITAAVHTCDNEDIPEDSNIGFWSNTSWGPCPRGENYQVKQKTNENEEGKFICTNKDDISILDQAQAPLIECPSRSIGP